MGSRLRRSWWVRPAEARDAEPIGRLQYNAWQHAYTGILPREELAKRDLATMVGRRRETLAKPAHPEVENWVCHSADGQVLGWAATGPVRDLDELGDSTIGGVRGPEPHRPWELMAIYVEPKVERRGVGSVLLNHLEEQLQERGVTSMILWVLRDNQRARAFYRSHGYWTDFAVPERAQLGAPSLCMTRQLASPPAANELRGPRLRLRKLRAQDRDKLFALDQDPEVMRYINGGVPHTAREFDALLPRMLAHEEEPYGFFCAFYQGRFAGWFHLRPSVFDLGILELGYRLKRSLWGRGLATEGSSLLLDHARHSLRQLRVDACALPENLASIAVMKKCGMRHLETLSHPRAEIFVARYLRDLSIS